MLAERRVSSGDAGAHGGAAVGWGVVVANLAAAVEVVVVSGFTFDPLPTTRTTFPPVDFPPPPPEKKATGIPMDHSCRYMASRPGAVSVCVFRDYTDHSTLDIDPDSKLDIVTPTPTRRDPYST